MSDHSVNNSPIDEPTREQRTGEQRTRGQRTRSQTIRRWCGLLLLAILGLFLLGAAGLVVWAKTGEMAAETAPVEQVKKDPRIRWEEDDQRTILHPANVNPDSSPQSGSASRGLLFYPGAKVDAAAYAPRLSALAAQQNTTVVIAKPILNLALFDQRNPDTFTAGVEGVESWWAGGHSMGGVRACQVAEDEAGLLLLASYCAQDLSQADIPVVSISGGHDGLSTPEKIAKNRDKLPADAVMVEIAGANHAAFGDYGPQSGDGESSTSDEEMNRVVASTLESAMNGDEGTGH